MPDDPGPVLGGLEGEAGAPAPTGAANRLHAVERHLRTAIVRGALRPNERLIEAELAERLGVSRTPIREALQRLAADLAAALLARDPDRAGAIMRDHIERALAMIARGAP